MAGNSYFCHLAPFLPTKCPNLTTQNLKLFFIIFLKIIFRSHGTPIRVLGAPHGGEDASQKLWLGPGGGFLCRFQPSIVSFCGADLDIKFWLSWVCQMTRLYAMIFKGFKEMACQWMFTPHILHSIIHKAALISRLLGDCSCNRKLGNILGHWSAKSCTRQLVSKYTLVNLQA